MSYTPNNTFGDIPLTGVLIPGITEGYVTESKYVKGGYIVVQTIEERDGLLDKSLYEDKKIAIGTPVFVFDENKTYRYMGEDSGPDLWLEDTADLQQITQDISNLQQIALNQKTEIDGKASQEDLTALTSATANSFASIEVSVNAINTNISTLQEQIDKNTSDIAQRVDGNTFFAALMNIDAAINTKASTEDVNQQIGIINENTIWDGDKLTTYEVGGLAKGSTLKGKSVKEILMMILYGYSVLKPTYDPEDKILIPTVTVNDNVNIASNPLDITGTVHFDRGEILLNGEHQNWLAGKAYSITITNSTTGASTTQVIGIPGDERVEDLIFNYHLNAVPLNETTIEVKVNYTQGAQPIDNFGNPIDAPFPAGTTEPATFKVTGLTNTWTGTSPENVTEVDNIHFYEENGAITDSTATPYIIQDDEIIAIEGMFQDLEEGEVAGTGFQAALPEVTEPGQIPTILIQTSVNVTGVKIWSEFDNVWEWYSTNPGIDEPTKEASISAFTKSDTIYTKTINHQEIQYYAYTYNGSAAGDLYFRFYIN